MKALLISVAVLVGASSRLHADLLTYRFAGVVSGESSQGKFLVGHPYTLTVTIDTLAAGTPANPEMVNYSNAITSFVFDYDSGSYQATQSAGSARVANNLGGQYDYFILGLGGFPPVAGRAFTGANFYLRDSSATAFSSKALPHDLRAVAFDVAYFGLTWGIDFDTLWVSLTIDSISFLQRRPEITSWNRTNNTLVLTVEFPSKQYTNLLERSYELGSSAQWNVVSSFVLSGGNTNWSVPLLTEQSAVFYRVRGQ